MKVIKPKLNSKPIGGLINIIENYPKENPVVAEIGTYVGATTIVAASLVKKLGGKYFAIDWFHGSDNTTGPHKDNTLNGENVKDVFKQNIELAKVDDIISIFDMTSLEAANVIPDASLDICFIDADHRYESIKADILAYLPKMKPGGIICGHDFEKFGGMVFDSLTEEELKHDFVSRLSTVENKIVESYEGKVIREEKTHDYLSLFFFHPGVIKAVGEIFDFDHVYMYDDCVWAVHNIEKALKKDNE